jgi:hypothetical protein
VVLVQGHKVQTLYLAPLHLTVVVAVEQKMEVMLLARAVLEVAAVVVPLHPAAQATRHQHHLRKEIMAAVEMARLLNMVAGAVVAHRQQEPLEQLVLLAPVGQVPLLAFLVHQSPMLVAVALEAITQRVVRLEEQAVVGLVVMAPEAPLA